MRIERGGGDYKRGLWLRNPVMLAAGTVGYGLEYARLLDLSQIGALVTATTTLRPRRGRPQPRLWPAPAGLLVNTGYPNPGLAKVIESFAPVWAAWPCPVLVSIAGETPGELAEVASQLAGVEGVSGIELNLADLDAEDGLTHRVALTADGVVRSVAAVVAVTTLPVLVKLPVLIGDTAALALAAEGAGATALTMGEPVPGLVWTGEQFFAGGLIGPAVRPVVLRLVRALTGVVHVPLVAVGGVTVPEQVGDYLAAGATAVQLSSGLWRDPGLVATISRWLSACDEGRKTGDAE